MEWVINDARGLGWADDHIHREYFAAAAVDTSGDGAFEVKIASTGLTLLVEKDQAVTTVLASNGLEVPTSCEQGVCGLLPIRVFGIAHRQGPHLCAFAQQFITA